MALSPAPSSRRFSDLNGRTSTISSCLVALCLALACKGAQEAPKKSEPIATPAKSTLVAPAANEAALKVEPFATEPLPKTVPRADEGHSLPKAPEIVVEEAGTAPTELRYQFTAGVTKKFSMKMSVEPKVTVNGQALPATGKTTFDVRGTSQILSVSPDGTARRLSSFDRFTPVAGGLPAQALGQLKSQLGLLAGLKIEEQVTSRGLLVSAEVVEIPAQDPSMQALIKNLQDGLSNAVLPLPQQAIGAGGRFRTSTKIATMGMSLSQTTHFTIESIVGPIVKVKVTTEQSTPPAVMDPANLPAGAKVELLKFSGTGIGQVVLNLKTLDMTSDMALSMSIQTRAEAPGAPGPITSTTENKLHVTVQVAN
jgi:hypothetical protein